MAKLASDEVIDGGLTWIAEKAYLIWVCTTGSITTFSNIATYNLTSGASVTSTNFTIGDGDASGRKIAVSEMSSLNVSTSGTAGQIAISSSDDALMLVTDCTTQALTSGNTVTIPTWDIEIADPT